MNTATLRIGAAVVALALVLGLAAVIKRQGDRLDALARQHSILEAKYENQARLVAALVYAGQVAERVQLERDNDAERIAESLAGFKSELSALEQDPLAKEYLDHVVPDALMRLLRSTGNGDAGAGTAGQPVDANP